MSRHPLRTFLTTLWACWFVLLVSEPTLVHSCPMHDGTMTANAAANAAEQAAVSRAPKSGDPHAGHDMHAAAEQSGQSEHGGQSEHHAPAGGHACTCLGHCSASSALTIAHTTPLAWLAGVVDVDAALDVAESAPRASAPHVLPFANGPPVMARA